MKTNSSISGCRSKAARVAFSLIEVMVAMGLLTFIIVGLLLMFQQTQRAFRSSMTQTDVLEGGRAIMEMTSRDIEQASATHYQDIFPNGSAIPVRATNFFTEVSNFGNPLVQELPGTIVPARRRTNIVQRLFFMTRLNQDWIGTGYEVRFDDDPNGYVGTLYRFSMTNPFRGGPFTMSGYIWTNIPSRIADGIVHLRVRPFAGSGFPIVGLGTGTRALVRTNEFLPLPNSAVFPYAIVQDALTLSDPRAPDEMLGCYFINRATPASVELELGILEPRVFQRYKSIPSSLPAAGQYLSTRAAQVHLFRQRIPIRNADLSVFP